jgi:hypothetical protein
LVNLPEASEELTLLIDRYPKVTISTESSKFDDVPARFHRAFIDWLKAKLYRSAQDGVYNPEMAELFEGRFYREAQRAKSEKELVKTKVRVVAYGGI